MTSPKQPQGQPTLERKFNDDLLLGQEDQALARSVFPQLYHVLDHPELREEFLVYNRLANKAKNWVHGLGVTAITLATLALLFSAISPLLALVKGVPDWVHFLSLVTEIAGLVGSVIAVGGLRFARWKKEWLEARLMTERLRQWHFQILVCKGKDIDASSDPSDSQAQEKFRALRATWFTAFMHDLKGKLDAHLEDLVDNPEAGYQWLHEQQGDYSPGSQVLEQVFAAYRQLRLKHQANYATHKLKRRADQPLWRPLDWPAPVLVRRTETLASLCLLSALLVSCVIVIGMLTGHFATMPVVYEVTLPGAIIGLMILNVATRALQDGLAVHEETQRYSDYAGKSRYLLTRFDASRDRQEKCQLMKEMERAAVEELKGFLRAHSEARFII
jgi:hypothetical protein